MLMMKNSWKTKRIHDIIFTTLNAYTRFVENEDSWHHQCCIYRVYYTYAASYYI